MVSWQYAFLYREIICKYICPICTPVTVCGQESQTWHWIALPYHDLAPHKASMLALAVLVVSENDDFANPEVVWSGSFLAGPSTGKHWGVFAKHRPCSYKLLNWFRISTAPESEFWSNSFNSNSAVGSAVGGAPALVAVGGCVRARVSEVVRSSRSELRRAPLSSSLTLGGGRRDRSRLQYVIKYTVSQWRIVKNKGK